MEPRVGQGGVCGAHLWALVLLASGGLLAGCWADFPDERLGDGLRDVATDGGGTGAEGGQQPNPPPQPGCKDGDGDGFGACDGDCNDDDDKVFPGQEGFFDEASAGSFDYDCNGEQEREKPDGFPGECKLVDGQCQGEGWRGDVPPCGDQAKLVTCERRGEGCREREKDGRQACR